MSDGTGHGGEKKREVFSIRVRNMWFNKTSKTYAYSFVYCLVFSGFNFFLTIYATSFLRIDEDIFRSAVNQWTNLLVHGPI